MLRLKINLRVRRSVCVKWPRHPRYNPERDDAGAIRGDCRYCEALYKLLSSTCAVQIAETALTVGQVGWFNHPNGSGMSELRVVASESGARLVVYAGQPQGDPIVSYGPFIGDTKQDIARLFAEYRAGRFPRLSEIRQQQVASGLLEVIHADPL